MSVSVISENIFCHIPNEKVKESLNSFTSFLKDHYDIIEKVTLLAGLYLITGGTAATIGLCAATLTIGASIASKYAPKNITSYLDPINKLTDGDKGLILATTVAFTLFLGNSIPLSIGLATCFGRTVYETLNTSYFK